MVTRDGSRRRLLLVKRGVCVKLEQRCVDEIAGGHAVYKCLVLPSNRPNLVRITCKACSMTRRCLDRDAGKTDWA